MRPAEHFYSKLAALQYSRPEDREYAIREFIRLTAPALGPVPAEDLCRRTLDRIGRADPPGGLQKLGAVAAFFLGEYDGTIPLDGEDWEDIRETLEDVSGDMDLATLTSLMDDLLSRGKI